MHRPVIPGIFGVLLLHLCALSTAAASSRDDFKKPPYLQNVSRHSIAVLWESRHPTGVLTLQADKDTAPRKFSSTGEDIHEVIIDKLTPGRRYQYSVTSGKETIHGEFATAPNSGSPFSFVVFGDSRSNASAHTRVVERIRQEVPDFLLGTGDIVNEGGSQSDWDTLFAIEGPLMAETVVYPSLGNHDREGRGRTASNFRKYFSLPENSPDPERYYAFTYSSARFLILDSNAYSFALTDQTVWIEQQLQAARLDQDIRHVFITMHHPPYSVSLHGGQSDLREAWTPLFEKYQVDAVFSGHDHVYSRAHKNGIHYFVSGGGGAPLYPRKKTSAAIDEDATKFFERVNHHLRIHVVGDHVEVVAVRADGSIMETVSWGQYPRFEPANFVSQLAKPAQMRSIGAGIEPPPAAVSSAKGVAPYNAQGAPHSFGILGILGGVMTLGAGVVIIWAWRQ